MDQCRYLKPVSDSLLHLHNSLIFARPNAPCDRCQTTLPSTLIAYMDEYHPLSDDFPCRNQCLRKNQFPICLQIDKNFKGDMFINKIFSRPYFLVVIAITMNIYLHQTTCTSWIQKMILLFDQKLLVAYQANNQKDISSNGLEGYHQLEGLLLILSETHESDGKNKVVKMALLNSRCPE